jgi:hypothetical protein
VVRVCFGRSKSHPQLRFASPAPKPDGFGLRLRAKRKIGSGYGLNENDRGGWRELGLPVAGLAILAMS